MSDTGPRQRPWTPRRRRCRSAEARSRSRSRTPSRPTPGPPPWPRSRRGTASLPAQVLKFDQNTPPLPGVAQIPLAESFATLNQYPDGHVPRAA